MDNYQDLWITIQQLSPDTSLDPAHLQLQLQQYRGRLTNFLAFPVSAAAALARSLGILPAQSARPPAGHMMLHALAPACMPCTPPACCSAAPSTRSMHHVNASLLPAACCYTQHQALDACCRMLCVPFLFHAPPQHTHSPPAHAHICPQCTTYALQGLTYHALHRRTGPQP